MISLMVPLQKSVPNSSRNALFHELHQYRICCRGKRYRWMEKRDADPMIRSMGSDPFIWSVRG